MFPGETIPVDGVIASGQTSINQAVMTGESLPVDKAKGDEVSSGTVNQFGAFEMKATKVGEDSSIQKMIRLVQSADAGKAKIVGLADRWATWIVVTALTAAVLTWLITRQPIRAVTILVVFCPCSLVLATPTAIMAAIGNATKHGFLVKEGDALERLAKVKRVTFDKTGTLTVGVPKVVAAESVVDQYSDEQIYTMVAGVEKNFEHPLGKAIVNCFRNDIGNEIPKVTDFAMVPGQGVKAVIDGKMVCAGNERMIRELPHLFSLSKKMMTKITFNLSFSMLLNFVAIVLAMTGILNLVIGALVHNAGSVFVIINSAFLLKWRRTK